ncbi:hypothetical protein [Roseomonas sp. FDAARGOS_362]|uniref:hypothetical protein n=1 Tax=Roseomonas sp. FDAARGOS_362 TaxID=2018065 RepID=UPI0018674EAA|nr:hypothetical protein [Roseomonas sp. FDAARGOS_362]
MRDALQLEFAAIRNDLPAYSSDRGRWFQAIVGTNSTASWAGFLPIDQWFRKAP